MTTESIKQAEKMSKVIRERSTRTIYPDDYYFKAIADSQKELLSSTLFLEQAFSNPKLLFTHADKELKSTKSMIFKAVEYRAKEQKMGNLHDFQALLADKMNSYLNQWAVESDIKATVNVEVMNPLSFPSIFCVYVNEMEIIQFNIFEKWYGIRIAPATEEALTERNNEEIQRCMSEIDRYHQEKRLYLDKKAQPHKYAKTIKDFYVLLFKRSKIQEVFNKFIKTTENHLKREEQNLQAVKDALPKLIEKNRMRKEAIEIIQPFFEKLGYRRERDQHKLY